MQSKLDELERREEALRRINDELDVKKKKIMSGADGLEESKDNSNYEEDRNSNADSDNSFD